VKIKSLPLHRYWIEFDPSFRDYPTSALGYGVTGYTFEDALNILQNRAFRDKPLPPIASVIEDVDVSTLDRKHMVYMGVPVWRGVWFPLGYQDWD
jgi:hypothetical protein